MTDIAKKKRVTARQVKGALSGKPTRITCMRYQRLAKVNYFPTYREETRRRLLDDDVRKSLTSDFLHGVAEAARQKPSLLVLHLPHSQVDRISQLEERCDKLMSQVNEQARITEHYRKENATLLRKIIAILEPQQQAERGRVSSKLVREFHRLSTIWKMDTIHMSDVREKCSHPAYQQIIALGESALPLIFEELDVEPDDWFAALRAITGVDPAAFSSRSTFEEITYVWLAWAKSHGHYRRDADEEGFSEPQLADVRG